MFSLNYISILHCLAQMLNYWLEVLSITLPLFQTFLGIWFKLFIFVLNVGLYLFRFLNISPNLWFSLWLFLLNLFLKLFLILFQSLFSKMLILFLFRMNIRELWLPSLFEFLILFKLWLLHIFFLLDLIFQWLLILLFKFFPLFLFLYLILILFISKFLNLFI